MHDQVRSLMRGKEPLSCLLFLSSYQITFMWGRVEHQKRRVCGFEISQARSVEYRGTSITRMMKVSIKSGDSKETDH
jgi:hypothetical protein